MFFSRGIAVSELALLFAGISSSITAGMASGSIFAGMFGEPFDIHDNHSRIGVLIAIVLSTLIIFFLKDTFKGLIISQVILSIQLPWTILGQISLTSREDVMGKYKNAGIEKILLYGAFMIVSALNMLLLLNAKNF